MKELKPRIHDDSNGLDYVLVGDYYIPDLALPQEDRPIGRWGRMHREYLREHRPPSSPSCVCPAGSTPTLPT